MPVQTPCGRRLDRRGGAEWQKGWEVMPPIKRSVLGLFILSLVDLGQAQVAPTPVVGQNVNMVAGIGRTRKADGTYSYALGDGDPFLTKQNEPSIAVSSLNPLHLLGGANDYRLIPLAQSVVIPGETAGADSWIGVYRSVDGGRSWRSTVLAGCPVAIPQCAGNTALQGLSFASDPTVRPGPYGSFFLSFIAGNRTSSSSGVVGVQRFFDLNNNIKADDNPVQPDVLNVVDTGTTGQFLDKTWNISDVPRSWNSNATCSVPTSKTPVPAFNVYVSYSNFVGQASTNPHPQVFVATSTNCGFSFGKSVKVSESVATNQGTVLTIDPNTGAVYLFWRQIYTPTNGVPDAIYFVKSTDGGNTWSKPAVVALINPFEQETSTTTFRAENFPTAAVDGSGRVYVAWSQWGVGPVSPGATTGAARIVITTSKDGGSTWTTPAPVDNNFQNQTVPYAPGPNAPSGPPSWSAFNPYNATGYGHQLQPSLTFAGGKLALVWLDQRLDHTAGRMDCSEAAAATNNAYSLSQCTEVRDQRPSTGTDPVARVFTDTISDSAGLAYRHTLDVFGGQALPGDNPVFAVTRISQYPFGSHGGDATRTAKPVRQLQAFPPDLPLFANATAPFIGDYLDIVAQAIIPSGKGGYVWNSSPSNAIVFHAAWADNRDVIPPGDGVSWASYQPIMTLAADGVSVVVNTSCLPGYAGAQNQNVYTAPVFGGIDAFAVINSKQLSGASPRQFSVVVRNGTGRTQTVSLAIANQPAGGSASFNLKSAVTSIPSLSIYPSSALTRAVWVSSTNSGATVTVNVIDAGGNLIASVPLNPDPNATIATAPPPPPGGDIITINQGNVAAVNTSLSNTTLTSIDVSAVDPTSADLTANSIGSMDLGNMDLGNMDLGNMDLGNMDLGNMDLGNMDLGNMDLGNMDLGNTTVAASSPTTMDLGNAGMVDSNFLVFNNSSTTDVTMDVKSLMRGNQIPPGYKAQLFVHKVYFTQTVSGGNTCSYAKVPQKIAMVNAPSPTVTSTMDLGNPSITDSWITVGDPSNATISLMPQEIGYVTYRLVGNPTTDQGQNQQAALELGSNGVKSLELNQSTTVIPVPLVITTLTLPAATAGNSFSFTLQSSGGFAPVTWQTSSAPGAICPANSQPGLPPGVSLSAGGILSGTPTTPGLYCFIAQVQDSTPAPNTETDRQTLTLTVHGAQSVNWPSGTLVYSSAVTLPATSNVGLPVTYSATSGCSVSGNIVTATAGTGTCTVTASNSGNQIYLPLSSSQVFTLSPALLTVTANNQIMTYSGPLPILTASYSGFVNGDTAAVLSGAPALSTPATVTSSPGMYPITAAAGTLSATNYTFRFVNGTLTIGKATPTFSNLSSPTITAGSTPTTLGGNIGYGSVYPSGSVSVAIGSSPAAAAAISASNGSFSASVATGGLAQGTYTIHYSYPGDSNFNAAAATGTLHVAGWTTTGSMNTTRSFFAAVLLTSGKVLVAGGLDNSGKSLASGEVYDPATGRFTYTANNMPNKANNFTATLLPNGNVLIAGGGNASAQLYNRSTNSFSSTGGMSSQRSNHTATLLPNGLVLIAGGSANSGATQSSAQLYNPATGAFSSTGSMTVPRDFHTATLLPNGKVLIAGGRTGSSGSYTYLSSAEIYDPGTGKFTAAGSMTVARYSHTAALVNGVVLIAGGANQTALATAERYDPASGTFTATGSMAAARQYSTATVLAGSSALEAGGSNGSTTLATTELYQGGAFTSGGNMTYARSAHVAVLLGNGSVLVAGGRGSGGVSIATAELLVIP